MPKRSLIQRYLLDPIVAQLKQGITAEKIALSIAIGTAVSVFPIVGTTTTLCLAAGVLLGLNQPLLQIVNYLAYPLQLLLLPVFIRTGEWVFRAPHLPFSVSQWTARFHAAPLHFAEEFAMTLLHAAVAWLIIVPPLAVAANRALRPAVRALRRNASPCQD